MKEFYAHSVEGKPESEWQGLEEHLRNVAELAKKFGDEFGSGEWAYLAGLWHQNRRYSIEFQVMLTDLLEDRIFYELHCAN